MALFLGTFETTIDGKHRLAISSEFRQSIAPEEDGESFVLMLGPDRHLWLYPDAYYRKLLVSLRRSPLPTRQSGKLTMFFGMARLVKCDAQGRIVLPEASMEQAVVSDNVVLVGNDDHVEIWPRDEWKRHVQANMPSYGEMLYEAAERLNAERCEPQQERKL